MHVVLLLPHQAVPALYPPLPRLHRPGLRRPDLRRPQALLRRQDLELVLRRLRRQLRQIRLLWGENSVRSWPSCWALLRISSKS